MGPAVKTPTGPRCQAAWEHGEIVGVAGDLFCEDCESAMQEPVLDFMRRRQFHAAADAGPAVNYDGARGVFWHVR
jgi:hypothetical protein